MRLACLLAAIILLPLLNGCALYHPQRSIFVSSSVQTVPISLAEAVESLYVAPISYPPTELSDTQHTAYMGSGVFVPISHTYIYDDVDREYLMQSIVNSFEAAGVQIADTAPNQLTIEFTQIGMASGTWGSVLVLDATATFVQGDTAETAEISVRGESAATVAAAKNNGVELFIEELAALVGR
jgi:hypothetical protein